MNGWSRWIEGAGFVAAILVGVGYGAAEIVARLKGIPETGFPWGMFIMQAVMALPKTVGRATAGKVWERLSGAIPRRGEPPAE